MKVEILSMTGLGLAAMMYPAVAASQGSSQDAEGARSANENRIVCKYQAESGTRFKSKTCKTKAQWEQMRIQQQRDAEDMFDRPVLDQKSTNPNVPN